MRNIHKYIMLFVMAFAVASCTEEEIVENKVLGKPGEEVKFGLSLDNGSRTIYGPEVEYENNEGKTVHAFPIYWVDGDKVQIFSPQCLEGRRNAEYVVSTKDDKGDVVTNQNYASNLTKTGDYGVQWGTDETADFYSLYPSGNYEFSEEGDDMVAAGVSVLPTQTISYDGSKFEHEMSNCLLYANTQKVKMADGVVNLSYTPLSTVLWFEVNVVDDNFLIQGIELTSKNQAISGTFNYNLSKGEFVSWLTGKNSIAVSIADKSGDQEVPYTLKENSKIDFPVFLAPDPNLKPSDMTITVYTDKGAFVKTLSDNVDLKLAPGQIHKVILPELKKASEEWEVATWMKFVPRNVYLSEISIPGTWNSLNPEFQAKTSIDEQYAAGVRAFHFETRWRRTGNFWDYQYSLGIADGHATGSSGSKYCTDESPEFSTEFNNIIQKVKDDEYMILVCSFAQGSAQRNGVNGWIKVISELCKNEKVFDARNIDSQTLVGHVLGKVIVIVNVESEITESTDPESALAANSKCFFNYTPSEVPKARFVSSDNTDDTLLSANSDVYWNTNESETFESDIKVYSTQAQISSNSDTGISTTSRGYAPTITERLKVLNLIVDWSKGNYTSTNYDHDQWIYLGLGGYKTNKSDASTVGGSHAAIENTLNPWINNRILEMEGTIEKPYYPVGIVLMNNKKGSNYTDDNNADLNYKFTDVVKNILMLNNKYRLQYNPNAPKHTDDSYKDPYSYKDTDDEGNGNEDVM